MPTAQDDAHGGHEDAGVTPPRVLISYAHASPAHVEAVRELWVLLRSQGIDAKLDLPAAEQRQDWAVWMMAEVQAADYVLVVASPEYRDRAEGSAAPDEGRGVQFEARLIRDEFYRDQEAGTRRFLPVLLDGFSTADIPIFLGRETATHYSVSEMTPAGVQRLVRLLTDQPWEIEPQLGDRPDLSPRGPITPWDPTGLAAPPILAHEIVLDVTLEDGRLRCRTTLAGTLLGEHEATLPAGIGRIWENLTAPSAAGRLADAGGGLRVALLDDTTVRHLTDLLDRSAIGTVVDIVVEADGDAMGLPYELLRLSDQRLLATVPGVRMRRRVRGIDRPGTDPLPGPLKILVAVGAPYDTRTKNPPLDIEAEMQAILDALPGLGGDDAAQAKILEVAGPQQIAAALEHDQYHVLHLSAHGSPDGVELEDEDGNAVPMSTADLVTVLRSGGRPMPLVVLSSCAGAAGGSDGLAATLLQHGADRVVAMQTSVTDRYATRFAGELYEALAGLEGLAVAVAAAVAGARRKLETEASAAARSGAPAQAPEYAVATLLSVARDLPLVDPAVARVALSQATASPAGGAVRTLRIGELIGRRPEQREAMMALRGGPDSIDRFGAISGVVLTGVGGIGKTALAGRIETRLAAEGWLPAVHFGRWNPSLLIGAVVAALGHRPDPSQAQAVALLTNPDADDTARLQVVLWLLQRTRLLVLFDDFEQNLEIGVNRITFKDPGFEEVFGALLDATDAGRLLVTSRYPVPGYDAYLHQIALPPLSPAELRRMVLRLPALRDLESDERQILISTIGGHPRLLEFANALLRGGRANLKEVTRKLRALAGDDVTITTRRSLDAALHDVLLLGSRDILLDELWRLLSAERRELMLQAAVSREPQSLSELGVSRWGEDPSATQQEAVREDAERLIDLTLFSRIGLDQIVVHPWIADAVAERQGNELAARHMRAAVMRIARVNSSDGRFADLVEVCRHFAGAHMHDDLVGFGFQAVDAIKRFGELSVAAFLGEIVPLVVPEHPHYVWLADRETQALLNTGSVSVARQRTNHLLAVTKMRVEAEPQNPQARRDMSFFLTRLGEIVLLIGDLAAAERCYRDALATDEKLALADPGDSQAQRDISVSYNKLGDLLLLLGDGPGAERHHRDSLAISERLAAADPTSVQGQEDLAVSHVKLGDVLAQRGDPTQAGAHYRDGLAIVEQLAGPDDPFAQSLREKLDALGNDDAT